VNHRRRKGRSKSRRRRDRDIDWRNTGRRRGGGEDSSCDEKSGRRRRRERNEDDKRWARHMGERVETLEHDVDRLNGYNARGGGSQRTSPYNMFDGRFHCPNADMVDATMGMGVNRSGMPMGRSVMGVTSSG
jgi:hypothetical protein